MTKLLCPHCTKLVSVPDDAAGKEAPCPECGKPFPVPARYEPAVAAAPVPPTPPVPKPPPPPPPAPTEPSPMSTAPPDRPAPPPGLVPPAYPAPGTQLEPPLPEPPPPPAIPPGYTKSRGITISPRWVSWVPVVCLTVIVLLTFFPWIGSYIGRSAVYSQNAWLALAGDASRNFKLEDLLPGKGEWLNRLTSDWWLLPYFVCLILAVVLAWAERGVATLDRTRLPPQLRWIAGIWPYRNPVIAGLAALALGLLLIQMLNGFGLERALKSVVAEQFNEARKAAGDSGAAQARIDFQEEQELAKYDLQRTTWLYLAVLLHVLAVLAITARAALDARGHRPPPRLVFQY